jgi:hypothetical protein
LALKLDFNLGKMGKVFKHIAAVFRQLERNLFDKLFRLFRGEMRDVGELEVTRED